MTTKVEDLAGNTMLNDYSWTFTTKPTSVAIAPTAIAVSPINHEADVSTNIQHITVQFSVPMDETTLTPTSFTLFDGSVGVAALSVTYSNQVADLTLNATLASNRLYSATITTQAKSIGGVALANNYVWSFTTGLDADTVAPTVLLTAPFNNDFNVSTDAIITATFSEAMKSSSITQTGTFSVEKSNDSTLVDGSVTYLVGDRVASFKPNVNLEPDTDYTVLITTTAQDLASNAMRNSYSWTFTTASVIPPRVVAIVPQSNETNVSSNIKHITAQFSVPMDETTFSPASFTLFDNNLSEFVTGGVVEYANQVADLSLALSLNPDTNYTATITTDAKDRQGVALLSDYVWNFKTGPISDLIPPKVFSTSPRDNDSNISIKKIVTATFSEAMKSLSITKLDTFTLKETNTDTPVEGSVSYSVINKIASFSPNNDLLTDTNYTAIITIEAQDLAGNAMLKDYNWTFVTENIIIQPELVALGLASSFGIAATAGVTNTSTAPTTQIDGDVVLNPSATCNGVNIVFSDGPGFGLCGGFAPNINGSVITPLYPDSITAQPITDDLRAAYLSITPANMPGGTPIAAPTTLGEPVGSVLVEGDNLFFAGVYQSITSILITGDLTLDAQGDPDATFVFQSASTIGSMPNTRILLAGGAKASNIYWQAGSDVTLQTATIWNGNIFAYRDITMVTGSSSCGRLFAGAFTSGAFVFDSNRVSVPGNPSAPVTCK